MATKFYFSPVGPALYPWLNKADTKFNADGLFKVDLALSGSEAANMRAKVDAECDKALKDHIEEKGMTPGEAKKWSTARPYTIEEDDQGEPTGRTIFHFKQNQLIKLRDGSTKSIKVGNVIPGDVGFCAGWGASGTRFAVNGTLGEAAQTNSWPSTVYIGPSTGLGTGQVLRLRQLVGWVTADRPSTTATTSQARTA